MASRMMSATHFVDGPFGIWLREFTAAICLQYQSFCKHSGVGAAIGLSVLVTVLLVITGSALESRAEQLFAGTMSLLAVGLITWMIFWMAVHARSLKSHLHGEVDKALGSC